MRLVGVDAARGVALLGMMSVHVLPATDAGGGTSLAFLLASGRAAALFAVLAGVGLALASGGRTPPHGRRWGALSTGVLVRAGCIGVLGLALGSVDQSNVALILVYYAVLFVLAVPLLPLRAGALAGVAVVAAVAVPLVSFALRPGLPGPERADPSFASLADPAGLLQTLLLTGYYPALAWTAYVAAGLAAGRLDLRSWRVASALLAGGAAVAVGARALSGVLLGPLGGHDALVATAADAGLTPRTLAAALEQDIYGNVPTTDPWWLAVAAPHASTPLDLLHTIGTALAVLGGCLLLARWVRPLLAPLAWAGSMTLTLYTLHVLALGAGWGPDEPLARWVTHAVAAMVLAGLWLRIARRGPLETGVHALSSAAGRTVGGDVRGVAASR